MMGRLEDETVKIIYKPIKHYSSIDFSINDWFILWYYLFKCISG